MRTIEEVKWQVIEKMTVDFNYETECWSVVIKTNDGFISIVDFAPRVAGFVGLEDFSVVTTKHGEIE